MNNVFLDIETVPSLCMPSLDQITAPASYKKQESIDKWLAENAEAERWALYKKQSVQSMKGEIFCIGAAIDDDEPIIFDTLEDFWKYSLPAIRKGGNFVGFNSRTFDMKWIWRHSMREGLISQASSIQFNKFRGNVVDIRDIWACEDYQDKFGSLGAVLEFLGIGSKTEDIDGSKVFDFILDGRGDEVKSYCGDDVRSTRLAARYLNVA